MNKKSILISGTLFLTLLFTLLSWSPISSREDYVENTFGSIFNPVSSRNFEKYESFKTHSYFTSQNKIENYSTTQPSESLEEAGSNREKPARWIQYKNEEGAFSVNLPEEPTNISKETPNPLNEDGEPYKLKMFMSNDKKNDNIYIFRYNDMPNGYYMNDKKSGFASILDNLEGKAVLIDEPKEIELGGVEGREIEVKIQGKYHAIMRMYIRGNRIYVLLAQKINTTDKVFYDNEFFKTFKFEEFNFLQPTTYQPTTNDFKVSLFENIKVSTDSVGYESTQVKQVTNHYSVNPRSGGLYQLSHGDLQEYAQIKDLKAFYEEYIQLYFESNDTIYSQKDIVINGKQGLAFTVENKSLKIPVRHQIWLDNNRLFLMIAYLSQEEQENPISDLIFNSYTFDSTKDQSFDRLSSKTDKILKDLHSVDTLTVQRALGAFEYYKFESTDLPKLYQSLKETYKDSLYSSVIKETIIGTFTSVHDEDTIETLKTLYIDTLKDEHELKAAIISVIPTIEEDNAIETYKYLMKQSPPASSENYAWQILAPFRDSIPFLIDNFKLFTSLIDDDSYRNSILNISTNFVREYSDQKNLIIDAQNNLLKFAKKDLDLYMNSLKDTLDDSYKYSSLMNAYLEFFNETAINSLLTNDFTGRIISIKDNNWYKNQAVTARIKSQQSLDKSMVNELMDSLYYRFEIMKAYHDTAQFHEVPDKYKQAESFAELSLDYNLSVDDYEPESMQMMGEIEKNGLLYYAYKVKYDEGNEALTSYLITVGPIVDVSTMAELKLYDFYSDWEKLDYANWKLQAEQLIPDLLENED